MRKKFINKMQQMLPNKVLRREQFSRRVKNSKRHERQYSAYSYRHGAKASRFNRWQEYKRLIDKSY
jgi:hypothetical protein